MIKTISQFRYGVHLTHSVEIPILWNSSGEQDDTRMLERIADAEVWLALHTPGVFPIGIYKLLVEENLFEPQECSFGFTSYEDAFAFQMRFG